jgi:hypothetical protein
MVRKHIFSVFIRHCLFFFLAIYMYLRSKKDSTSLRFCYAIMLIDIMTISFSFCR